MRLLPQTGAAPCGDAVLYVDVLGEGRGFLFDLGHAPRLSTRLLRRAQAVFVTHTHLDHFVAAAQFLRLSITREQPLDLWGPPGFVANVDGLFRAFTWNISEDYPLTVTAHEYDGTWIRSADFSARGRFVLSNLRRRRAGRYLLEDDTLTLEAAVLDHGTPVLAYRLNEKTHININKDAMRRLGYDPGSWIQKLKEAVQTGAPPAASIETPLGPRPLKKLMEELVILTEGQSIGFAMDFGAGRENLARASEFLRGVHLLYIEASFEAAEARLARERNHLTTVQAGRLARRCRARKVVPLHLSPKHLGHEKRLFEEVQAAFRGAGGKA
jgi:ribonuclease Z